MKDLHCFLMIQFTKTGDLKRLCNVKFCPHWRRSQSRQNVAVDFDIDAIVDEPPSESFNGYV